MAGKKDPVIGWTIAAAVVGLSMAFPAHGYTDWQTYRDDAGAAKSDWGYCGSSAEVLRKTFVVEKVQGAQEAIVQYEMGEQPWHHATHAAYGAPQEGVKWNDMVIRVNGAVAVRGSPMELGTQGWHRAQFDAKLLKAGENTIDFTWVPGGTPAGGGGFYLAIDTDTHKRRSSSSADGGKTFTLDSLRPNVAPDARWQGEYMVRLQVGFPGAADDPAAWKEVFADDFNRGGVLGVDYFQGNWVSKSGKWDVAGELKGSDNGATIMCTRLFKVPFRVEYECSSDNPGDLSLQFNSNLDKVFCYVGFGCDYNTENRISTASGEILAASKENLIEAGRRHKVVVEATETAVRQVIDGKETLKAALRLPKRGVYFGFSIWNPGSFRNVKVYSPHAAEAGKEGPAQAASAVPQPKVREFQSFEDWPVGAIAPARCVVKSDEKCSVRIADVPTWLYHNIKDRVCDFQENEDPAGAAAVMKNLPNRGPHLVSDHCLELSSEDAAGQAKASASFPMPAMSNGLVEFDMMADSFTGDALRVKLGDQVGLLIDKDGTFCWEAGNHKPSRLTEKVQYHGIHGTARFGLEPHRWYTVRIAFDTSASLASAAIVNLYCYSYYPHGEVNEYLVLGEDLPLPADSVPRITFETAGAGRFYVDNLFFVSRTADLASDAKWQVPAREIMKVYYHLRKDPPELNIFSMRNTRSDSGIPVGDEYRYNDLRDHPEQYAVILDSAKKYNAILIEQAFLAERLRGLERAYFYCATGNAGAATKYQERMARARQSAAEAERLLADLYRFYADCYLDSMNQSRMKEGFEGKYAALKDAIAASDALIQSLYLDMVKDSSGQAGEIACRYEPGVSENPTVFADGSYRKDGKQTFYFSGALSSPYMTADLMLAPAGNGAPADWFLGKDYGKEGAPKFCLPNDRLASRLNKAPDSILTMNTWFGSHYQQSIVPTWWIEQHANDPDIFMRNCKGDVAVLGDPLSTGRMLDNWHPEVLAAQKAFLQGTLDVTAGYNPDWLKRFNYIGLGTENQYPMPTKNGLWETGYNRAAIAAFRDYLKKIYGKIETLNAKWGSNYAGFDAIQPPEDYRLKPRPTPTGLAYEFERFRQKSWADWEHQGAQWLQEKLPHKVPFGCDNSYPILWCQDAVDGFDMVRMFEAFDIILEHYQQQFADDPAVYRYLENLRQAFNSTTGSGEWYVAGPDDVFNEIACMNNGLRQTYELVQWGRSMLTYWGQDSIFWLTGCNWTEFRLGCTVFRRSACYVPLGIARARAHQHVFLECPLIEPEVGILESETSFCNVMNVRGGLSEFSALMFSKGHDYGFLFERPIMEGRQKLDGYKVIILPNALSLPEEFTQKLLAWVEKGGVLVVTGPAGLWNQYGQPNGLILDRAIGKGIWSNDGRNLRLPEPFAGTPACKALYRNGGSFLLEGRCGAGKVYIRQGGLPGDMLYEVIQTSAPRLFYGEGGKFHLAMRRETDASQPCLYLTVLNPDCYQTVEDEIVIRGNHKIVTDISCSFPLTPTFKDGETRFKIRLAPAEGIVVQIES